jgi:bacillithiol biosynthesis deacetylase BshB1
MPAPPLDVLALAAHPDDVELCAGGTMCLLAEQGYRTGVVDLTRGELGTRGTPEIRAQEAARAAEILGLAVRENLGLPDGDLRNTKENQRAVIRSVRRHRPHIVLLNAPDDRHPDHGDAARLCTDALFYAGLARVETDEDDGTPQAPWRPAHALHYMHAVPFEPTFVVDVSSVWDRRVAALRAFGSQFHTPDADPADGPQTFISTPDFFAWVEARARTYGYRIGATYGEPLLYRHGPVGVSDLLATLGRGAAQR